MRAAAFAFVALVAGQSSSFAASPPALTMSPVPGQVSELAGRYVSAVDGRAMDIALCGARWCAVGVDAGGACGAVIMTFVISPRSQGPAVFESHLERRDGRFAVQGTLWRARPDGTLTLRLHGERGDRLSPWRRTFPYQEAFARAGDAACRHPDGVS